MLAYTPMFLTNVECTLISYITATAGEEGRKEFMCEIVLGKFLGDDATQNIVKFIGCVTTQSKRLLFFSQGFIPIFLLYFVWNDNKRRIALTPEFNKLHIHQRFMMISNC